MSNLITSQIDQLAVRFDLPPSPELYEVLKSTAFKDCSDAQLSALLIVAKHVRISPSNCWEWSGAKSRGYGQLTYKGRHQTAHRFSFGNLVEPIRKGMWVLHNCDNRSCVNPSHLYQGTPIDNRADALDRNRWSHPWRARENCQHGHSYESVGFAIASDGSRVCRECQRINKRNQRARKELK